MADPHPTDNAPADVRERARWAEERFRLLVDSVRDYAIFMLDPLGRVTSWNAGAQRINGWTEPEILGRHFSVFYPPEDVAGGKCERELVRAARDGRLEDEGWRVRKDGSRLWANVVITAMRSTHGELLGFAKVTRDLTERRRAEEEQVRLMQAEEKVRLRDEFLSVASHELRTPLTALRLQLEALEREARGAEGRTHARTERALQASRRLGELVDALLDVSRIATGRLLLDLADEDLAATVRETAEAFDEAAVRASAPLELALEAPLVARHDRLRIRQLVTNLLANALKYAPGAPVEVSLRRAGDAAVLRVSDRGPGIPEADLARVFGRFERASSWRHYGGLGLGLYVGREIVAAHGGTVTAAQRDGGGAVVEVVLPIAGPPPP